MAQHPVVPARMAQHSVVPAPFDLDDQSRIVGDDVHHDGADADDRSPAHGARPRHAVHGRRHHRRDGEAFDESQDRPGIRSASRGSHNEIHAAYSGFAQ